MKSRVPFDKWLNDGVQGEIQIQAPFNFGYIENIFEASIFNDLKDQISRQEIETLNLHPFKYFYGPFLHKEFFKFINSSNFIGFIQDQAGLSIRRFKEFPFPQIHHFKKSSSGLEIHNDFGSGRQFATLFYMTDHWEPGMGGELVLYKEVGNTFKEIAKYPPRPNSLFYFEVNESSYHAVMPMSKGWHRNTLIIDWELHENNCKNL